ncbi:capsid portal protein [Bovine herpesvirus type 1.2 strain SM023]|uniref:Capsid portal protein n=2 Tax=Bovine herpesvirus type 1.2 TaxID=79890 RepID=A0A089N484_BHV1|nr:capsid portal protein [Bovine herpesvirus type 1.2 strain SM023]AIQ80845.1 capsid portal protein [Bovine herpesvirus type 1.2 strain SP1777]AVM39274.1 portal protein [Bovine alphaherpesvirus 1]
MAECERVVSERALNLAGSARDPGAPGPPGEWVRIHPTPRTRLFKEILLGELGYTEGQGVYSAVRCTETVIRQVQATILSTTLNAARYEDVARDWRAYTRARGLRAADIAARYGAAGEAEVVRLAEHVFETWRRTLQMSLVECVRGVAAAFPAGGAGSPASFARYVDWLVCLGLVPLRRHRPRGAGNVQAPGAASAVGGELARRLDVAGRVLAECEAFAADLLRCAGAVTVLDYDRTEILYNFRKKQFAVRDAVTGEEGECFVLWAPVWRGGDVLFESPMQRLHGEVLACHALREHARLCQLLNTVPLKVLVGRRAEGAAGESAPGAPSVEKLLGEGEDAAASSSAARLIKLIVNMKGMRHIGDISETVRSYLDDTAAGLFDVSDVDTSQPGFGAAGGRRAAAAGGQQIQDAFRASVVHSINGMLEGYVSNLFKTIESLKGANRDLADKLRASERELQAARERALLAAQRAADAARGGGGPAGRPGSLSAGPADGGLGHEVIDISGLMGPDSYVANSFQSRYIPTYADDVERLSRLWEQELLRCFKLARTANNQGQEVSVVYSNSSISLILAPYFFSVLRVRRFGFLIAHQEACRSEEELCGAVFKKTRLETYLAELAAIFTADARRALQLGLASRGARERSGSRSRSRSRERGRSKSRSRSRSRSREEKRRRERREDGRGVRRTYAGLAP